VFTSFKTLSNSCETPELSILSYHYLTLKTSKGPGRVLQVLAKGREGVQIYTKL